MKEASPALHPCHCRRLDTIGKQNNTYPETMAIVKPILPSINKATICLFQEKDKTNNRLKASSKFQIIVDRIVSR